MATLAENIEQAINDFDSIQAAIIEKGVSVPYGTPTNKYGSKILQISGEGSGSGGWEGNFPPGWEEDNTGIAVEDIAQFDPILWQPLGTEETPFYGTEIIDTTGGTVNNIAISDNGSRMVAIRQTSPFVRMYDRDGNGKYALSSVQPTSFFSTAANSCAISQDGNRIFVTKASGPYLLALRWDGSQYLEIPQDIIATVGATGVTLSPDNKMLIVSHDRAPWLTIYKVDPASLTKIANPEIMPSSAIYDLKFNSNGNLIAISCVDSPNVRIYKVENDSLINISTATITFNPAARKLEWSPDSLYLAISQGTSSSTPIVIYKYENETLTRLTDVTYSPNVNNSRMAWIKDKIFLAASEAQTIILAQFKDNQLKYLSTPVLYPKISVTGGGQYVAKSKDDSVVVWGNNGLIIYGTKRIDAIRKVENIKSLPYGDLGFASDTALNGQQCRVNLFPILRGK